MTASVLHQFYTLSLSSFDKAMCELFIGAFFFAMQSCKYIQVTGPRRTNLLKVRNIKFYNWKKLISHRNPYLHQAECVSITFKMQKKDSKNDTITQYCSSDKLLCPVKIWSNIIWRIINYDNATPDTTVNYYMHPDSTVHKFHGKEILNRIRLAEASLGYEELGFHPEDIELHSAHSGAAMAMYLAGVPVFTIMLLGHWSSDAFLRYIRKQVQEFSKGVSQKMILNKRFFTITSVPCASSNRYLLSNLGPNFKDTIRPLSNIFRQQQIASKG